MGQSEDRGFAYTVATGRLFCSMRYFHKEAESLLGRPILTHEFADGRTWADMRRAMETSLADATSRGPSET